MTEEKQREADETSGAVDAAAAERGPLRRCIASGEVLPKERLLRFVVGPDNALLPDPGGKLPGRGLWLQPDPAMIRRAVSRGLFSKAARAKVTVPDDLGERVATLERRRLMELLGLARRAGVATAGFEKVKTAIERGRVALLLEATDGAAGGRERLTALLAQRSEDVPVLAALEAAEMGQALGRDHAVHVAIAPGRLAERLEVAAGRTIRLHENAADADSVKAVEDETKSEGRRPVGGGEVRRDV